MVYLMGFIFSPQVNQEGSTETLQSFVADIMKKTTRKIPALVVVDLEQYFRLKIIFSTEIS